MATKTAERSGLHVACPFCERLCDGLVRLSFCTNCYAEYWPHKKEPWRFTFTDEPTGKQAWSKAMHRSGGMTMGKAK